MAVWATGLISMDRPQPSGAQRESLRSFDRGIDTFRERCRHSPVRYILTKAGHLRAIGRDHPVARETYCSADQSRRARQPLTHYSLAGFP